MKKFHQTSMQSTGPSVHSTCMRPYSPREQASLELRDSQLSSVLITYKMTRIRGRNRSKLINIDLGFDVKTLKTWMMENEKKSTVGGLFAINTSANNISYHQQTASSAHIRRQHHQQRALITIQTMMKTV